MATSPAYWIGFTAGVIALLVFDLTLLRRDRAHVSFLESLATTLGWVVIAVAFGGWVTWCGGSAVGLQFFTGYVIEYALSLDNIFIFVLVFTSFRLPAAQQRRLLFWGVLGAMIMRGLMVGAGTALLARFEWVIYVFGAYIVYAGVAMLWPKEEIAIEKKWTVRFARRCLPLSANPHPTAFIEREAGRWKFTLLFLVLLIVEATDLIFALDSVPAVFGVTRDPFIVYTSNICAILGLRSLYFLLAGAIQHLTYLHYGLAAVLVFIGAKMVGEAFYPISTLTSLCVVGGILAVAILASLLKKPSS